MSLFRIVFLGSVRHFQVIEEAAAISGATVDCVATVQELKDKLDQNIYSAAVVEDGSAGFDIEDFLAATRQNAVPVMPILLLGRNSGISDASRLIRSGIYHCADEHVTPTEWADILDAAHREVLSRSATSGGHWRQMMVGSSPRMEDVARIIALVAKRRCTVLITGETGTGKEVAARAIHTASDRAMQPMVALNCSAIPEHLLEAELFGHTRGAFTGAVGLRIGRFEQAHNSTLFLDEIGDMPLDLQAKLLRALQEREIQRLGSSEIIKINVRVIAATNANLKELVRDGKFREDLYYRLNVVPVQVPPLRERPGDIDQLARHFVAKICRLEGIPRKELYNDTLQHLASYSWPGNVRELENMVEKAVVMSGDREALRPEDFVLPLDAAHAAVRFSPDNIVVPDDGIDFAALVARFERTIVDQALQKANGNKTQAAGLLRLKRTTLISKLQTYAIQ